MDLNHYTVVLISKINVSTYFTTLILKQNKKKDRENKVIPQYFIAKVKTLTILLKKKLVFVCNFSLRYRPQVIQFLDLKQRDRLIKKIYEALLPKGVLILSEKIHHKNIYESKRIFKTHHKFKSSNGYSDLEISRKRDSLEGVLLTESEQDHILRAKKAGFIHSEKILSNLNFKTFKFLK